MAIVENIAAETVSRGTAQQMLGVSRSTIERLWRRGKLRCVQVGGQGGTRRFLVADIRARLEA